MEAVSHFLPIVYLCSGCLCILCKGTVKAGTVAYKSYRAFSADAQSLVYEVYIGTADGIYHKLLVIDKGAE